MGYCGKLTNVHEQGVAAGCSSRSSCRRQWGTAASGQTCTSRGSLLGARYAHRVAADAKL
eukprot:88947-Chlamydomonas_euryale.AAC.1